MRSIFFPTHDRGLHLVSKFGTKVGRGRGFSCTYCVSYLFIVSCFDYICTLLSTILVGPYCYLLESLMVARICQLLCSMYNYQFISFTSDQTLVFS